MLIVMVVKIRQKVLTPMMTGLRESGFKRLERTPGGGCRAGVVAIFAPSMVGGKEMEELN